MALINKDNIQKEKFQHIRDLLNDLESVTYDMDIKDLKNFNEMKQELLTELESLTALDFLQLD